MTGALLAMALTLVGFPPAPHEGIKNPLGPKVAQPVTSELSVASIRATFVYGACLAKHRRQLSGEFLSTIPGSQREQEIAARLFQHGYCVHGRGMWRFSSWQVRGTLSEALSTGKHTYSWASPFADNESYQSFTNKVISVQIRSPDTEGVEMVDYAWIAYCTARANEMGVRGLLGTTVSSPEEGRELLALRPTLDKCKPPRIVEVSNSPQIRFLLAEALFLRGLKDRDDA